MYITEIKKSKLEEKKLPPVFVIAILVIHAITNSAAIIVNEPIKNLMIDSLSKSTTFLILILRKKLVNSNPEYFHKPQHFRIAESGFVALVVSEVEDIVFSLPEISFG